MDLTIIAAVLFDMDGTLVDSDAAVERAWRTWAGEYGVDPDAVLAVAHGAPAERTVRLMLPGLAGDGVASAAARQLELQYDDLSDVVPTTGAHELLAALRLPWAVVTSADLRLAKARLDAAGIEAPVLVTVEDVRAGKPDPEGYLRAAELLGVAARRCLVVEDAEVGVAAGRAAGAKVAALKGVDGDLRIEDLTRLHRLLNP
ncbi:HAD-IA family hydrolase [Actinoplanes sp. NPDC049118]|uniref:HAD-IA family hydrolase n=1 Tax=Actinoplanes sp. NPDC049118 TaxID=3155769 RepID=UPI00340707D3